MGQVNYKRNPTEKELFDERLEELRMLSGLKVNEIYRLRGIIIIIMIIIINNYN